MFSAPAGGRTPARLRAGTQNASPRAFGAVLSQRRGLSVPATGHFRDATEMVNHFARVNNMLPRDDSAPVSVSESARVPVRYGWMVPPGMR